MTAARLCNNIRKETTKRKKMRLKGSRGRGRGRKKEKKTDGQTFFPPSRSVHVNGPPHGLLRGRFYVKEALQFGFNETKTEKDWRMEVGEGWRVAAQGQMAVFVVLLFPPFCDGHNYHDVFLKGLKQL